MFFEAILALVGLGVLLLVAFLVVAALTSDAEGEE